MTTYVIVGGVAGGATAAARLRRLDEGAHIVVIERGEYVSFANCGLPYYVGGVIPERSALLVSTPEKLEAEFAIDVRVRSEVVDIDRDAHVVVVRDRSGGQTYRLPYDKLVLSPGASPIVPPLPGVDLPGVYTLRTIPDTDAIKAAVDEGGVRRAAVIGGGFIGLEMAENLSHRGVRVSVVEMMDQVLAPIDPEMAALVHRHLREAGVRLMLGSALQRIDRAEGGTLSVVTAGGERLSVDMVVLAIGVRPENALARDAGLELGPKGHVIVNEHMQTSDPDIYAVGDAVQVTNPVTGGPCAVPLAGPANRQARVAADHIAGRPARYGGTWGTSIVKVFDLTVATTGANARTLREGGIPFAATVTHSQDHVGYYPGATQQSIKLLYTPDEGRLLGAQVVGYRAVDRTIDALVVALQAGMTVYDLETLELAYAPPYGAAKDPVNIAGYVAANHLRGDTAMVPWSALAELRAEGHGVLDVRTRAEFEVGHVAGAVNIPHTELRARLSELDPHRAWAVYCKVGRRAYVAERILRQNGYDVVNVTGGMATYEPAVERQSGADREEPAPAVVAPRVGPSGGNGGGTSHGGGGAPAGGEADRSGAVGEAVAAIAAPVAAPAGAEPAARLDATGLQCPGPILSVYKRMQELAPGKLLEVRATDPGFARDVQAWCDRTGNALEGLHRENGTILARLRKGQALPRRTSEEIASTANAKTMVVFSGDLDRALASFVIANGALAMGQKVTMFFTFWGLNVLRRDRPAAPVAKSLVERMFGWMLPRGAERLKLSRLHMGGLGTAMIKGVMRSKHVDPLPQMIRTARENGVRLVACQMSMDLMGIREEELIDGVEVGGVATYINETDRANATLFI